MLKNLFFGGISSLINRGISIASIVFISQDSFGYIPGSISGKYQSDYVDSSIWDSWWLATTMKENWGETVVRQSFAPSAMVDPSGTLFTLNFHNSSGSSGIYYYLKKFTASGYSVSSSNKSVYPWSYFNTSSAPGNTPITINMSSRPNLSKDNNDQFYFRNYIHNAYLGCIAQDLNSESRVVLFFPIANLRIAASSGDFDGILYLDFDKSTLEHKSTAYYSGYGEGNQYSYNRMRPRRCVDSHDYNIEMGN